MIKVPEESDATKGRSALTRFDLWKRERKKETREGERQRERERESKSTQRERERYKTHPSKILSQLLLLPVKTHVIPFLLLSNIASNYEFISEQRPGKLFC